jgi:L-threonylcarbamoyladenylate synthase
MDNPMIVHFSDLQTLQKSVQLNSYQYHIVESLTPGPISFIISKKSNLFSSGLNTVCVRIPSLSLTRTMLQVAGPVSAPSANLSGKPSITRAEDAIEVFEGKVDCILKGEQTIIGVESTVLDLSSHPPQILRPGGISLEKIKDLIPDVEESSEASLHPPSPGMKYKHYAPDCEVIWFDSIEDIHFPEECGYIGNEPNPGFSFHVRIKNNLEYMHALYSFFIACEKKKIRIAYCQRPWEDEFKKTLVNRISKAISKI